MTVRPLELVVELNAPPDGVTLHVTPVESLVVAVRSSCWPMVSPARRGEIAIEILPALTVRERVADAVCALELESATWNVSETSFAGVAGVPAIAPLAALRDSPDGSDPPISDHL